MSERRRTSPADGSTRPRAVASAVIQRLAPVVVPWAIAVVSAATGHAGRAVAFAIVGLVAGGLIALGVPIDRVGRRLASVVERVLTVVLATLVWPFILVAGVLTVMAGGSALSESGATETGGWSPAGSAVGPFARRPFGAPGRRPPATRRVLRLAGIVLMVVGLVALALPAARAVHRWVTPEDRQGPPIDFPAWAYPDDPWVAELHDAGWPVGYHPSLGWQSTDVRSRYLNVVKGVRTSWSDAAAGEAPVVWFLGGSTMYGLGQRDDHTIASEVARSASADGRPIRAVNLGVPGYNQWQEVALMSFRLSRGERPDLVVIYDGANDLTSMAYRAEQGIEPLDEPPNRFHDAIEQETRYRPEPRGSVAGEDELRDAFVSMYGSGVDLARHTAESYDVRLVVAWQPTAAGSLRTRHDDGLMRSFPDLADSATAGSRERNRALVERLGPDLLDLSSSVDDAQGAVYIDPVHTNELGSRLIAATMWPTIDAALDGVPR